MHRPNISFTTLNGMTTLYEFPEQKRENKCDGRWTRQCHYLDNSFVCGFCIENLSIIYVGFHFHRIQTCLIFVYFAETQLETVYSATRLKLDSMRIESGLVVVT